MEDRLEIIRGGYAAWNEDDFDAILVVAAEDLVVHPSGAFPDVSEAFHGHDGAREFWNAIRSPWEEFRIDVVRLLETDDAVVGLLHFIGRGREGIELSADFGHVFRFRPDGKVHELSGFASWAEALEAVGLDTSLANIKEKESA